MILIKNMIMIGSTGRNRGKTEFATQLISRFAKTHEVVGLKVTTVTEKNGKCPRGGQGCGVCSSLSGDFLLTKEEDGLPEKDTVKMKAAGAKAVYWLRVMKSHLTEGITEFLSLMKGSEFIICESNSLRLVVEPGLFLVMGDEKANQVKASCKEVIAQSDRLIMRKDNGWTVSPDQICFEKGKLRLVESATAIILAGGKSTRMGQDKALLPYQSKPLIHHIRDQLQPHFREIIISTNAPEKYSFLKERIIEDQMKEWGPMMGILSALEASHYEKNFVVSCDIPNMDIHFIRQLFNQSDQYDIVVPKWPNDQLEPLFAVYQKSVIPKIKEAVARQERRIRSIYDLVNTCYIPITEPRWVKNINTPSDYQELSGADLLL